MRTSESIIKLLPDYIKACAKLENVSTSEKAEAGKRGTYKYFNLAALRDETMPKLIQHNLTILQTVDFDEAGQYMVFTRLQHISGEWIEARYPIPVVTDMQIMGSAITYGRRYSWMSLLGLHGDKDDDGAATSTGQKGYIEAAFSRSGMDPFHRPGEQSSRSSKTPYDTQHAEMVQLQTLAAMTKWWDAGATVRTTMNNSFSSRLFIEFMKQACARATIASELTKFWNGFSSAMEAIRAMDPHEADVLDDMYEMSVDALSRVGGK